MKKLVIDTKFAVRNANKEITVDGVTYRFDPSFIKRGGQPVLIEFNVDGFDETGEWMHEESYSFQANEVVNVEDYPWIVA